MIAYLLGGFGAGILIMIGIRWWNIGRHKRIRSLTKYVVFSITVVLIFTGISIFYQWSTGQELSRTLTTCFMSTFGGEVLFCALLKIFKLKEEKDETGYNTQSACYYSSAHDIDSAGDQEDPR